MEEAQGVEGASEKEEKRLTSPRKGNEGDGAQGLAGKGKIGL